MRILVIEDEARIQAFLARGLEAEGYTVVAADNGRDGLELAAAGRWDLVVLDLLLPGARAACRCCASCIGSGPSLPVVILSARSDLQTKLRGFELGATDYVPKPFSLDELLARDPRPAARHGALRRRARAARRAGRPRPRTPAGPHRRGRSTDLSDREFRLLHHLLLHPGKVISRERLLAEVWGYDFDPGSNVVDVCVRRLRQKLGPDAPIETVRHAGYRLAAA